MAQDFAQRRRVALALAVTVIAVPAAFLLNRSSGNAEPDHRRTRPRRSSARCRPPAAASAAVAPVTESSPDDTDALGTAPAGYLSGTTVPGDVVAGPDRGPAPARVGQGTRHVQQLDRLDAALSRQRRGAVQRHDHGDQPRQQPQRAVRLVDRRGTARRRRSCWPRRRSRRSPTSPMRRCRSRSRGTAIDAVAHAGSTSCSTSPAWHRGATSVRTSSPMPTPCAGSRRSPVSALVTTSSRSAPDSAR